MSNALHDGTGIFQSFSISKTNSSIGAIPFHVFFFPLIHLLCQFTSCQIVPLSLVGVHLVCAVNAIIQNKRGM